MSQELIFNQQIHSVLTTEKLIFCETNTGSFVVRDDGKPGQVWVATGR
jgi:hypothetical protein